MNNFARSVGRVLRRERERNRLTLRDVQRRSAGMFTASGVGGYERGERAVSVERFCRLAALYGARADVLLAEILGVRDKDAGARVDITDKTLGANRLG